MLAPLAPLTCNAPPLGTAWLTPFLMSVWLLRQTALDQLLIIVILQFFSFVFLCFTCLYLIATHSIVICSHALFSILPERRLNLRLQGFAVLTAVFGLHRMSSSSLQELNIPWQNVQSNTLWKLKCSLSTVQYGGHHPSVPSGHLKCNLYAWELMSKFISFLSNLKWGFIFK